MLIDYLRFGRAVLVPACFALILAGCADCTPEHPCEPSARIAEVGFEGVSPAPTPESLRPTDIRPATEWDYWALVPVGYPDSVHTVRGGTKGASPLLPNEQRALDSLPYSGGFIEGCLPLLCWWHIETLQDGTAHDWSTVQDLIAFLGEIDTPAEAVLLAKAHGYYIDSTDATLGGYLDEGGTYLLFVVRSELCPREDMRALLRVARDGAVTELGTEVVFRLDTCIVV